MGKTPNLGRQNLPLIDDPQSLFLSAEWLTVSRAEDYIGPLGAQPTLRRDGASVKPLTVYTVNRASGHALAMTDVRATAAPAVAGGQ